LEQERKRPVGDLEFYTIVHTHKSNDKFIDEADKGKAKLADRVSQNPDPDPLIIEKEIYQEIISEERPRNGHGYGLGVPKSIVRSSTQKMLTEEEVDRRVRARYGGSSSSTKKRK
jgi:hypothetical protein